MQFRKFTLDARHILGAVDAEVRLGGMQHGDFKAVLQSPQLFERFCPFQRGLREGHEALDGAAAVGVNADVAQRGLARADRRAGEENGAIVRVDDDFHDVAGVELLVVRERAGHAWPSRFRCAARRSMSASTCCDVDQRLVALHVHDDVERLRRDEPQRGGDAIGAGLEVALGRSDFAAELARRARSMRSSSVAT